MNVNPLPRRPPPVPDELFSSWIGRLARANHCSVEELCGYLGLGQGRVPERMNDLGQVNWARLSRAVEQTRDDIAAMTLPDTMHLPVQYVSNDDFQVCINCMVQTPGVILRHWRFAWSMTCENCGRPLKARHPADGLSHRISVRAAQGALALKEVADAKHIRRLRRIDRTLHLLKMLGLTHAAPLTSWSQWERFKALAAVELCTTRPLLGAAIILKGNDQALREVCRSFHLHRRVVDRIGQLSIDLERRLPRRTKNQSVPEKRTHQPRRPKVSESAIAAARQAISELGPHADRQALLARADAIWERESCVMR